MEFNLPTAIVFAIIVLIVGLVAFNEIRKKKQGKHTCSCGCASCNLCDKCNSANDKK
ncbi:MAG: FeoB-associated Cys-rich membrane protein [Clostridia bacterium]|nr:FeoB-associated Cys-rich membrane protein [Clostridia bacterium]